MNKEIEKQANITTDQLRRDLETLKKIQHVPNIHLAHFFLDLKNQVEKEIASTQLVEQDIEKKHELEKMRREIMEKIDTFEKRCSKTQFLKFSSFKLRTENNLNSIETLLNSSSGKDLNEIKQSIHTEEINIFKKLFQNKTIAFLKPIKWIELLGVAWDNSMTSSIGKLVIVNDALIPSMALMQW
jgi:hypothetical protein